MVTTNKPQWDIFEAVVLLEGYLEAQKKKQPKSHIIKRISLDLRQMAENRGLVIDDIYKNENGISYQMQSMESAYKGTKAYVPATKLFTEAVSIYNNDRYRFVDLLEEAKNMIAQQQSNKEEFLNWASHALTKKKFKWIEDNIQRVEQFANAARLISGSIFEITDVSTLYAIRNAAAKNKLFQIKHRKIFKNINEDYNAYIRFCSLQKTANAKPVGNDLGVKEVSEAHMSSQPDSFKVSATEIETAEKHDGIFGILQEHYQYGFRCDSIREMMRFRQFAEAMNVTLPDEDEQLKAAILASGTVIDDKVFCKNEDLPHELQAIVDKVFISGAKVIYYESLLTHEAEWMESHIITSEVMLKEYLQKNILGCAFSKRFMVKGKIRAEREAVTEEIKRVWGMQQTESVDTLSERLPYIPLGNIWRVISGNDLFVLVSEGEYLLIDRFIITEDEAERILDFVESTCAENGFASLSDVPLGDIEEENFELSQLSIWNAIYKKLLVGKYHLNNKILTKDKPELDAVTLLKHSIKGRDECTFDEVAKNVMDLTGGTNRAYAFQALYDEMVRVEKNLFVSTKHVRFDVDEIDSILSKFITDHFCAIRDVTTFAMFPVCGQSWNHYLLESYCYKYSKKYSLHVIHFNDKNAGIIAEKFFNKNYNEMLSIALARMNIPLSEETSGKALFRTGYTAKRKYAKLGEITQMAEELRKVR